MTTREQWLALAERCEKATGPDREVDKVLLAATSDFRHIDGNLYEMQNWYYTEDGDETHTAFPTPTASLDAITALIERELPVWSMTSQTAFHAKAGPAPIRVCSVRIFNGLLGSEGNAATEPLARCAAFCRAMAERSA